jgi:peptidyl-tRNA hydrolase
MSNIVLYILMRTDLESLTHGKACAQAAHAANQMVHTARAFVGDYMAEMEKQWRSGTGAYGTTVVLRGGGYESVNSFQELAKKNGAFSGSVIDRSYPIKDGTFVHHAPVLTCVYILGHKDSIQPLVRDLPLY